MSAKTYETSNSLDEFITNTYHELRKDFNNTIKVNLNTISTTGVVDFYKVTYTCSKNNQNNKHYFGEDIVQNYDDEESIDETFTEKVSYLTNSLDQILKAHKKKTTTKQKNSSATIKTTCTERDI
ncbi:hypothetical protein CMO90_04265 [Candidatus Woesearchaeota archaeon]|jgi:hypothetical protein|nr:hypothetical protein [Candidatus Woesearchaeota archaeon]|tara:strand:- start:144 stop:518 length:375 start_codon:yes stop_codon:yes gene_type:complete